MTASNHRGQIEPLAALVSVAAICVAVSVYAGISASFFAEGNVERDVAGPALESIWNDVSTDGVVDPDTDSFISSIDTGMLPAGSYVYVNVTVVKPDGSLETLDSITFGPDRTVQTVTDPPSSSTVVSRPVPVRVTEGDVRPGRLSVEVWQ